MYLLHSGPSSLSPGQFEIPSQTWVLSIQTSTPGHCHLSQTQWKGSGAEK